MFSSSEHEVRQGERPTLPPIRDLFRDELSRSARGARDSPPLTLARLRVSDEPEDIRPPTSGCSSSSLCGSSREAGSKSTFGHVNPYRASPAPSSSSHPLPLAGYPPASSTRLYAGPHHDVPDQQAMLGRSYSYDSSVYHARERSSPATYPPHRNTISTENYAYDRRASEKTPVARYPPSGRISQTHSQPGFGGYAPQPWALTTSIGSSRRPDDDERTPVASHRIPGPLASSDYNGSKHLVHDSDSASGATSKYECSYCGKGFNRPSSLKIHLNSHTGEKPFICPVESCGRSFSVLSNMRRHARVHTQTPLKQQELSSDEGSERSSPQSAHAQSSQGYTAMPPQASLQAATSTSRWHHRRDSSASTTSSTSSRRSRSVSSDDGSDGGEAPPEKRIRHLHK